MKLSAVVVIKNEGPYLVQFFEHLRIFCDEIIVIDQQSTDNSSQLSIMYADEVYISPNVGWNEMDKGYGVELAKNDWVVVLDPDERFPHETVEQLEKAVKTAEEEKCQAVSFIVQNFWDGIPVGHGNIDQNRIVKKGIPKANRIHSNFLPNKTYFTDLKQFHFKELDKHEKRLAERQLLDYNTDNQLNIKNSELTYIEESKKHIKEEKEFWENERKKIFEQLQPKAYLRLKHDKDK